MSRVLMGQEKRRHFGLVRLDPEKPSPTILGDTGCTTAGLVHPYEIRKLSIAEIKALASYPEEFQLVGSYRARWARIGNSVPPLLMKAIADHIRYRFFISKTPAR
jgi:DNA (cytosine-5)-methyltransferase 1